MDDPNRVGVRYLRRPGPRLAGVRNIVSLRRSLRQSPAPRSGGDPASHRGWRKVSIGSGPAILTSVASEEAVELSRLARGASVLEVGSAHGYTATVMALAGARVTAIDPHGGRTWLGNTLKEMQANLEAYGVRDKVEIVPELSFTAMPRLARENRRYRLVFIDGDHAYDAVLVDLKNALDVLEPDGIIACHDYGEDCCCPDVRRAVDGIFPDGPDRLTGTLFAVTARVAQTTT
jgi:SAM-dependent methyltransferase